MSTTDTTAQTEWKPTKEQMFAVVLAARAAIGVPLKAKGKALEGIRPQVIELLSAALADQFAGQLDDEHTKEDGELDQSAPELLDEMCAKASEEIKRRVAEHFWVEWPS